jgi:aminomethyltransferase
VTGRGAFDLLQTALARDVEFVTPEQCLSSLMLNDSGRVVDLVTAHLIEDGFWLETSFGRCAGTAAHLAALQADGHGSAATVRDRRSDLSGVLIEGPAAAQIVETCIDPDLGGLPFMGVQPVSWQGRPITVSRSGFTGEFGYKLFAGPADVEELWTATADARAAGFDALEIAMLEVRQPILHRELMAGMSALQAGYNWLIDITKTEFQGRDAVVKEFESGLTSRMIGWAAPAGTVASPGAEITISDQKVGSVVFARPSPGRGDVLGLALIDLDLAAAGITMQVHTPSGKAVSATTLAAPYVYPTSWTNRDAAASRE